MAKASLRKGPSCRGWGWSLLAWSSALSAPHHVSLLKPLFVLQVRFVDSGNSVALLLAVIWVYYVLVKTLLTCQSQSRQQVHCSILEVGAKAD